VCITNYYESMKLHKRTREMKSSSLQIERLSASCLAHTLVAERCQSGVQSPLQRRDRCRRPPSPEESTAGQSPRCGGGAVALGSLIIASPAASGRPAGAGKEQEGSCCARRASKPADGHLAGFEGLDLRSSFSLETEALRGCYLRSGARPQIATSAPPARPRRPGRKSWWRPRWC